MRAALTPPILALAAAETLIWAALFYTFPILLLRWEADFGWGRETVALAFTAAVGCTALAAPLAGRLIDRGLSRMMFPIAALLGGLLLIALSVVESRLAFFAVWALIGLVSAGCLYEPCFAFLTRVKGEAARGPITLVTLVAGFASTICFPLADWLAEEHGWRLALRVFAAIAVFGAAPLFLYATASLETARPKAGRREADEAERAAARLAMARPAFWLLAAALPLFALCHGMIVSHIIPILGAKGAAAGAAVFAASLVGPSQVAGRVVITTVARNASPLALQYASYAGVALACGLLILGSEGDWRIFGFVGLAGACFGVLSIVKPLTMADMLGRRGFGAISGALAAPYIACFAAAPFVATLFWRAGGYDLMLAASAGFSLLGLALLAAAAAASRR